MRYASELSRFGLELTMDKLRDDLGYVNLLRELPLVQGDRPGFLSISVLRQMAARIPQIGLVPREALEHVTAELEDAKAELEKVKDQRADLQFKLDRIQGLAKDGFRVQRQTGRPPKTNPKPKVAA